MLFLTNLNSGEIVLGKLCSTALASAYAFMAVFPMLGLQLLMGGITLGHFSRTVLALLCGLLFAMSAGFLASVICRKQFTAIALSMGLTILIAGGLMLLASAAAAYVPTRPLASWLAFPSPLYTVVAAKGGRVFGTNLYWQSAATVAAISLSSLGLTTLLLARTWRDRAKSARASLPVKFFRRRAGRSAPASACSLKRVTFRQRLLTINPIFWLGARDPVGSPVFMAITIVLVAANVYVAAPLLGHALPAGTASPILGQLIGWLCTGLGIHALVLYYAAMVASQRLAEDKQTGALELILSTPTNERTISRGLWLAFARRMLFPALVAFLVHLHFIRVCMVMASFEPPGQIPPGATPSDIFWSALLNKPLGGRLLDWEFGFLLRIGMFVLLLLIVTWPTLGWVGRWLGLRMKHPGFAPVTSLVVLIAPPVLLFTLACYLADKFNLDRLPERRFLPLMMWLALLIGIGHCVALSVWAGISLRRSLRSVAMSRYQPLPRWNWRPSRRAISRFVLVGGSVLVALMALITGYYIYQNQRSRHAWKSFQASLKSNGESLDLSPLLPRLVPHDANFARSQAFVGLLSKTNDASATLFRQAATFELPTSVSSPHVVLLDWTHQSPSVLHHFINWTQQPGRRSVDMKALSDPAEDHRIDAEAVLKNLQSQNTLLRVLSAESTRCTSFQSSTNGDASLIFQSPTEEVLLLERLHLLLQIRACASLALGAHSDAAEDVLAGLRLARLARQLVDVRSNARVQSLLSRSFQPLWEGCAQHAWTEPQLAALQRELGAFNLIADYTNAIRRVVLAHIAIWRAIPDATNTFVSLPAPGGGSMLSGEMKLQPRAWWFDNCIQLHQAGRNILALTDPATGRLQPGIPWSDLSGLPVDAATSELFQQPLWHGANPAVVAFAQTSLNQSIVACALERFRLTNNSYPQNLEELVPAFLERIPHDTVSGRPLIYQHLQDDTFVLRSVGPNGTDDRSSTGSDDWLWAYPPKKKPP